MKVIVTGLLTDIDGEDGEPAAADGQVLVELAMELNRASELAVRDGEDDADLDWDDMAWIPDPIDAGPGMF